MTRIDVYNREREEQLIKDQLPKYDRYLFTGEHICERSIYPMNTCIVFAGGKGAYWTGGWDTAIIGDYEPVYQPYKYV